MQYYIKGFDLKHYIFADESNTDKSRFMLIGGIWIDELTYNQAAEECKNFKYSNGWKEETKFNWKYISKKTLPQYIKFIDIFFKYNLQFNCIIIDRKIINLKENEHHDAELGFYKFYYELLRHNSKKEIPYHIYLDRRNNRKSTRLQTLKDWLLPDINVITLDAVNSNAYNLIQFSDLLLGAIGYHYNNKHLYSDSSPHKSDFAMYIANKIHKPNLIFNTNKNGYKNFNIWLYEKQLQPKIK